MSNILRLYYRIRLSIIEKSIDRWTRKIKVLEDDISNKRKKSYAIQNKRYIYLRKN